MSKTLMLHLQTSLRFSNQLASSIQSKPENDQIRVSAEKKFHLLESYRSSEIGSCVTKGQCWLRNQFSFQALEAGSNVSRVIENQEICYSLQSLLSASSKVLSGKSRVRVSLFENFASFLLQNCANSLSFAKVQSHSSPSTSLSFAAVQMQRCVRLRSHLSEFSQMRELMQPSS